MITADTTVQVKRGDKVATYWYVNVDLTGATTRLLARRQKYGSVIELAHTIADAANGIVKHVTTGTLEVGFYDMELEITRASELATAPTCGFAILQVCADLG